MGKIFVLTVIAMLLIIRIAFRKTIRVRSYTLQTSLFNEGCSINIILISDLHNTIHGMDQAPLIQKIKQARPDLILMAGDIIDDTAPIIGTRLLLAGIHDVAPIYYVSGNHEYRSCTMRKIRRELQSFGVIILPDTYTRISVKGNDIIIAGVEDPYKQFFSAPTYNQAASIKNAFRELDTIPAYKILLAHRPESIKHYCEYSFNLVVSGHAHGGQVRVPFMLNGLYAPHQGWFPRYAGGLYRHASLTHIISRGLSIHPNLPRIFNPPELVFIKIEHEAGAKPRVLPKV